MNRNFTIVSVLSLLMLTASLGCESGAKLGDEEDPNPPVPVDTALDPYIGTTAIENAKCPDYYQVLTLGPLYGGDFALATDINEKGWIVGNSHTYINWMDGALGFLWKPSVQDEGVSKEKTLSIGEIVELSSEEGEEPYGGTPKRVNDHGVVSGSAWQNDPLGHGSFNTAMMWTEEDGYTMLADGSDEGLSEYPQSADINNDGVIVGGTYTVEAEEVDEYDWTTGFTWTSEGGIEHLPVPGGALDGSLVVERINNNGQIIGRGSLVDYIRYAGFIWSETEGYKLLRGFGPLGYKDVFPYGMNDKGQVVGSAATYVNDMMSYSHPVVWDEYGYILDLGILPYPEGLISGDATGINNEGVIVGADNGPGTGGSHAWVYCEGSKRRLTDMLEETEEDIHISWVGDVNDDGWMAANGADGPYLLVPFFYEIGVD